ncbi:MAG TPA: bifunctional riboflavin kinase/FAD synthetase [Actinobacteria bacterium]|nr:bifunctional riboflavin kinase/FAD synthetase [Actinomycetota bacterium]
MYRWYGLDEVPGDWGRSVVTIGVFDGVHRGHQRIIARTAGTAASLELPMVVITFDPHPAEVIRPGSHPTLLCTPDRRAELLDGQGADAVLLLPFTLEFSRLGPEEFVHEVLVDRLHTAAVVVGENFTFGHRAAGDVALLAELGEKYDFTAEGLPLLADDGITVSSSDIRQKLAAGDVAGAADYLGRMHRVEGVVVPGHRRGKALGFPTANLATFPHTAIPADGVYAGWLAVLGEDGHEVARWPAALSVGTNPTFGGRDRVVEAYALDRDDLELYGAHVAVDFAARLRGMERFGSAEALAEQMHRDVDQARALTMGSAR